PTSHLFFCIPRTPPTSTLFPYTTLFRSAVHLDEQLIQRLLALVVTAAQACAAVAADGVDLVHEDDAWAVLLRLLEQVAHARGARSEEHTSELQSPYDLVCRLLLEKKKQR